MIDSLTEEISAQLTFPEVKKATESLREKQRTTE
jgi:hypothetical protein